MTKLIRRRGEEEARESTAGKKKKIRRTTPFGRQSTTSTVRRRVGRSYTTVSSDRPDMNERPGNYVYSRDVYNLTNPGFTPTREKRKKKILERMACDINDLSPSWTQFQRPSSSQSSMGSWFGSEICRTQMGKRNWKTKEKDEEKVGKNWWDWKRLNDRANWGRRNYIEEDRSIAEEKKFLWCGRMAVVVAIVKPWISTASFMNGLSSSATF